MKTFLSFLKVLAVLSFPFSGFSQSGINQCYGFDCWKPKWSVSVFAGSGLMGPGKDLEAAMNKSGLYDKTSDSEGLFFPAEPVSVSSSKSHFVWRLALSHQLNKRSSLIFNIGENWSQNIFGKEQVGWNIKNGRALNNQLKLHSIGGMVSLQYLYHPWRKSMTGFAVGPALLVHQVKQSDVAENPFRQTSILPGIDFGGQLSIINTDTWFLLAHAGYQWFPDDHVSAFKTSDHSAALASTAINSEFRGANVGLQNAHVGFSVGIKF